jgi:drug/metabolite transporter (DMT)-like permease
MNTDRKMLAATTGGLLRHRAAILFGGIVFSLGGVMIRMIETATPWQILVYRSGALALGLLLYVTWRTGGRPLRAFTAAGVAGPLGGACLGAAMIGFIWSVTHTTVANTLFIMAASPFFAAALGWFILGERVRGRTWVTMMVAGVGIGVMVSNGVAIGHVGGLLAAFAATLGIAGMTVILRWRRDVDLTAAGIYAALFSCGAGIAMSAGDGLMIPIADMGWCLLYGGPVMVLGFALYTHSGRFVPAAEVALLSLSEVAVGPVWVWLAIDERPGAASLAGGALVLTAVIVQILLGGRPRRPATPLD